MKKKFQSRSSSTSFSFVVTSLYSNIKENRAPLAGFEQNCSCITKQFCNRFCYKWSLL